MTPLDSFDGWFPVYKREEGNRDAEIERVRVEWCGVRNETASRVGGRDPAIAVAVAVFVGFLPFPASQNHTLLSLILSLPLPPSLARFLNQTEPAMRASGPIVASVMAASSVAYSSLCDRQPSDPSPKMPDSTKGKPTGSTSGRGFEKEKFAPRFDGLRFIETLVTAHR
ncbi:hypothetical protein H6P81_007442 [Aristolochia fimbriata]|uniref:Uncharacterized protein n=1 Tax=Aristolochia fimbriata TaxID=158543 RepID=A0AAV7F0E6_ARIFI|nr:hypothetical protein H6P81_007442 [Aristolochia fimbriata]